MGTMDIIFTVVLNALPMIILIVPIFFIRKKTIGKLYIRVYISIFMFYLIFWILPIIFQIDVAPNRLTTTDTDVALGTGFYISHFMSLFMYFGQFIIITLPIIFCVAPFLSFMWVRGRIKQEEGILEENLKQVSYEYHQSPYKSIIEEIQINDWSREKEILKLMIVLLPISIYLLQVILKITGLESISLTGGSTALGWFLEILFVYLAIFIFSIELLFSSHIALKGRFFGEDIREQTYKSLYTVGAPISILSLVLFVIESVVESGSIVQLLVIIYFFAYFIMASVIFVLFLEIFEPISVILLIKIVNWWKNKKERKERQEKTDLSNLYYPLIYGVIGFFVYLFFNMIMSSLLIVPNLGGPPDQIIIDSGSYTYDNPHLFNVFRYELVTISGIGMILAPILILAIFFTLGMKYMKNSVSSLLVYIPIIVVLTIMIGASGAEYWITGQTSYTDIFGFIFYTLRTASFEASFNVSGGISLLGILAFPYMYGRYIACIIFLTFFIYYIRKDFRIKNIPIDDKVVEKTVFISVDDFITTEDYKEGKIQYLITKNKSVTLEGAEQEREEIKELLNLLEGDKLLKNIKPEGEEEYKRFYFTLKYLFNNKQITIWKPEFGFTFERVEKQGLYVMYTDGRDVFNYPFESESKQDPALISGMFSAITSFIQETTHAQQALKTIDHGDITILIEYGRFIFSALFIKGKQTTEVRAQLKKFIKGFEDKHADVLADWNGALMPFKQDHLMAKDIFTDE